MLELGPLISSRIRRTLFEYLLAHPHERFYLRGLAKELGLSISPLRRELKRLERSGLLSSCQEANVLFYTVNTGSPLFAQFQQTHAASQSVSAEQPAPAASVAVLPAHQQAAAQPVRAPWQAWRSPLSGPALAGAALMGLGVLALVGTLSYAVWSKQMAARKTAPVEPRRAESPWEASARGRSSSPGIQVRKTEVTVVAPNAVMSGVMRSNRWQVTPGGFGGFSSGHGESY